MASPSFSRTFLQALLPDTAVDQVLEAALAQNMISPLRGDLFEFSHTLIRDAAYGRLPNKEELFGAAAQMQEAYQAGITTSRWITARALLAQQAWAETEALVDVTIAEAVRHEDEYCLADILWIKGECLQQRRDGAGESHFQQAEAMAAVQQARGLLQRFSGLRERRAGPALAAAGAG